MKWLSALVCSLLFSAASYAAPQVVYSGGKVSVVPDPKMPAVNEKMEILEQEHCTSAAQGRQVAVNGECNFLRGLYRYAFSDKGKERTLFYEFSVYRAGSGHAFIAAAPLELLSDKTTN